MDSSLAWTAAHGALHGRRPTGRELRGLPSQLRPTSWARAGHPWASVSPLTSTGPRDKPVPSDPISRGPHCAQDKAGRFGFPEGCAQQDFRLPRTGNQRGLWLGVPAALCVQSGAAQVTVPWDSMTGVGWGHTGGTDGRNARESGEPESRDQDLGTRGPHCPERNGLHRSVCGDLGGVLSSVPRWPSQWRPLPSYPRPSCPQPVWLLCPPVLLISLGGTGKAWPFWVPSPVSPTG